MGDCDADTGGGARAGERQCTGGGNCVRQTVEPFAFGRRVVVFAKSQPAPRLVFFCDRCGCRCDDCPETGDLGYNVCGRQSAERPLQIVGAVEDGFDGEHREDVVAASVDEATFVRGDNARGCVKSEVGKSGTE